MISAVPEYFRCGCYTWTVRYDDRLEKRKGAYGTTDFHKHEIVIQTGLQQDMLIHTFLHEVTHVVLNAMGLDELNKKKHDNQVDAFAGLLWQILESATGVPGQEN